MITLLTMALRMPPSVIAVAKLLHSKSKRRNSELDRSSDGFEEAQIARCAIDATLRPDTNPGHAARPRQTDRPPVLRMQVTGRHSVHPSNHSNPNMLTTNPNMLELVLTA